MKTAIIINEQHSLMAEQKALLPKEYQTVLVPASGWTKTEMEDVMNNLCLPTWQGGQGINRIIFISPIPYMIKSLSLDAGANSVQIELNHQASPLMVKRVDVMANDHREKKELPGGKVVYVVAKTGWYLA